MAYETSPSIQDVRTSFQRRGGRPTRYERASDPRKAMKRLFGYLMPFRQPLLLIVFFVLLQSLLGLVGPYLLGSAIDKSIGGKDINGLARNAVLMLIAYFLSNSFNLIANRKMAIISQNALKNLRRDLFVHIQWLPMRFFDTNPAGGLMSMRVPPMLPMERAHGRDAVVSGFIFGFRLRRAAAADRESRRRLQDRPSAQSAGGQRRFA